MRAKIDLTTKTMTEAQSEAALRNRRLLVAITHDRNRGVYTISPDGTSSYIQPLPKSLR